MKVSINKVREEKEIRKKIREKEKDRVKLCMITQAEAPHGLNRP